MRWMVAHPKLALDDLGHACGGPDLPAEPERLGPSCQQAWQVGTLLGRQAGRRSRRRAMAQGFWPLPFATAHPLADRSFGDSQRSGNVLLLPSLFVQFPGAQASSFAPVFRKRFRCVHTSFNRLMVFKL